MEFVRQEAFWLLWVIPLLGLLWVLGVWHQQRMRSRFGNLRNLKAISRISWSGRGWIRGGLFLLSLFLLAMALAQPRMVSQDLRAVPMPTDVVFLLDISPSMYANDMDPNRLGRAEQIIQKFLLAKQPQDRYGLVVFHYTSVVLSYLTQDPQNVLVYFDYLNQVSEPELGSNMGSALTSALRVIALDDAANRQKATERRRVFVLLSDGDDNIGEWIEPLARVVAKSIPIYTFGLGTANGSYVPLVLAKGKPMKYLTTEAGVRIISKAQSRTMRDIAELTKARFFRGEDNKQVNQAIEELLLRGRPVAGYQAYSVRQDLYERFLWAAFVCMILGIFI
ncbi:MAG: VWA domain-containing protein [Acidobacteria bacterium]|nr:VWA domain-containing protein [Acidobacteriota bacterium]